LRVADAGDRLVLAGVSAEVAVWPLALGARPDVGVADHLALGGHLVPDIDALAGTLPSVLQAVLRRQVGNADDGRGAVVAGMGLWPAAASLSLPAVHGGRVGCWRRSAGVGQTLEPVTAAKALRAGSRTCHSVASLLRFVGLDGANSALNLAIQHAQAAGDN